MSSDPIEVLREKVANGLIDALRSQRQVDEDGTECGVSRQAVDEAIQVLESLASLSAPKPEGEWVLVPREPSEAMVEAICSHHGSGEWPDGYGKLAQAHRRADAVDGYRAMLAVAPKPESAEAVGDRQAWYEAEIDKAERQWIDGFSRRYEAGDDVPSMSSFVALWLAERTAPPRPEASAPVGVEDAERWLVFNIGCIECGVSSNAVGVYATREEAARVAELCDAELSWREGGQNSFEVFDLRSPQADEYRAALDQEGGNG